MPAKNYYAIAKAAGKCGCCKSRPAEHGYVDCNFCRQKRKTRYYAKKAARLCVDCSSPIYGTTVRCEKCLASQIETTQAIKDLVFEAYGGYICKCCGETEKSFLAIDHIKNNGTKHRKEIKRKGGGSFYRWLRDNNLPPDYQILCYNCNHSKALNGGVCAHQLRGDKNAERNLYSGTTAGCDESGLQQRLCEDSRPGVGSCVLAEAC